MSECKKESPADTAKGKKRGHRLTIDSLEIAKKFIDAIAAEVFYMEDCKKLKGALNLLDFEVAREKARNEIAMEECREIISMSLIQLESPAIQLAREH